MISVAAQSMLSTYWRSSQFVVQLLHRGFDAQLQQQAQLLKESLQQQQLFSSFDPCPV
jgi:hypothetical protein